MNHRAAVSCAGLAMLSLAGCSGSTLNSSSGTYIGNMRGTVPYQGYYDGDIGPIFDGYWGTDGLFYYRTGPGDRHFRAGSSEHFKRASGGSHFQRMQGSVTPMEGVEMPNFPHVPKADEVPQGY